jgi:hypothetical protein
MITGIVYEEYTFDYAEPDFIGIYYESQDANGYTKTVEFWLERANAHAVGVALAGAAPDHPTGGPYEVHAGADRIRAYGSGPEQQPYLNLENERPEGVAHGGRFWFAMSQEGARKIAADLASSPQSDEADRIYSRLIDIGKEREREHVDEVVPFLDSDNGLLRAGAIRTLTFYLAIPDYADRAVHMVYYDPETDARVAAAMGLGRLAEDNATLREPLIQVALDRSEDAQVRSAAYIGALAAQGAGPKVIRALPSLFPNFDEKVDWSLLKR